MVSDRPLYAVLDELANPVCVTEPELELPGPRITYVNPALERATGYSRRELLGQTPRIFQGPKSDRGELGRLKRQLTAGGTFVGQTTNYRKDGSEFWIEWTISPIHAADGAIAAFMSVQHDRTGSHHVMRLVRKANSDWTSILDALEDMVFLEGRDGTVLRCNASAARHMGVSVRDALGMPLRRYVWAEGEVVSDEARDAAVLVRYSDDPHERTTYKLARGLLRVHVVRNVRERRRLAAVSEGLTVADHLRFMAEGILRELGGPVHAITSALAVLTERLPSLASGEVMAHLERMGEHVQRMDQPLRVLRVFAAKEDIECAPIDLAEQVVYFLSLSRTDFERRGVTLVFDEPRRSAIIGNGRVLQQVLRALIENAADAKQGRDVTVRFAVSTTPGISRLTISDDGSGLDAARQTTLFKPLVSSKPGRNGVGLSTVRRLLSAMGATVAVASELGVGTTVILTFRPARSDDII